MASLPQWCTRVDRAGRILLVAPHAGTSTADLLTSAAAGRRGNDLHTGDLAREMGTALDASVLINDDMDRNELDLNRVSDVVDRAPWFLHAIERQLERILSVHRDALVLFVHGWHVEQARCDLGVGAVLSGAADAVGKRSKLTARAETVSGPIDAFRRALDEMGAIATYGDRWPAAHRNNMMRLFRREPDERDLSPRIAQWVQEGRVDAVQLELGAPLRWPGVLRERLVDCAVRTLVGGVENGGAGPERVFPAPREPFADRPTSRMLQAFDAGCGEDGLGVVVGAMHLSDRDVGARLQLFPGGQRMGIFVGHGRVESALGVPDLYFRERLGGFDVAFDGRVLEADDAATYFRNEATRAGARLVDVVLRLSFRETAGGVGRVEGEIVREGRPHTFSCGGFSDTRLGAGRGTRLGTQLFATFEAAPAMRAHGPADEGVWRLSRLDESGWCEVEHGGRVHDDGAGLRLEFDGAPSVDVRVRTQAALLRPVGPGEYLHTTFGLAHVTVAGGGEGVGFFERRRSL